MISTSPLEAVKDEIQGWINEGQSYRAIANLVQERLNFETSERSIRRAIRRWGLRETRSGAPNYDKEFEKPGISLSGDEARIASDPREWKRYLNNTDQLLMERGLDPADWDIADVIVNEWDWHGQTYKQLKVHLKRKKLLSMIVPARVELGRVFKNPVFVPLDEPELVVFVGDQQAPHQDEELHQRFCSFLMDQKPERAILMGDTIDLANISRHAEEPDWQASTQECVNAAGQVIVDYRESSPETYWCKLPGNHDERLRRAVIDRLGDFYGLKPAEIVGYPDLPPIYDPVHLLRLDEIGVEYLRPRGKYDQAQWMVSPKLAARHGWIARKGSGSSALATLVHLGHSVIVGHSHRQSLVHQTKYDIYGKKETLAAAETGCMCKIEEGLGYTPAPDWQQGFATASVWADGTFKIDLATYVGGKLYWRDYRY